MPRHRYLAGVVVLSLLATACQQSASGSPEESAGASGAPAGSYLERAEAGEFDGTTVVINAQWIDAEEDNFVANLAGFAERTGIDVQYEGYTDYETVLTVRVDGGDAPRHRADRAAGQDARVPGRRRARQPVRVHRHGRFRGELPGLR